MELRHLEYFVAIIDEGTFTAAASACDVAQPALSQQIRRLERELGMDLFVRHGRRVELTEAGRLLEPFARSALDAVELGRTEIDALRGLHRGTLKLGLVQSCATEISQSALLGGFRRRYPDIELQVADLGSYAMADLVAAGRLDAALVGLPVEDVPETLTWIGLATDPLVGVVPADCDLAARPMVPVAELLVRYPLIHFVAGSGLRAQVDRTVARSGVHERVSMELGLITDMIDMTADGLGATIVPRPSIASASPATAARVRAIRLDDPLAIHQVGLLFNPRRPSPAARAFIDHVRETLAGAQHTCSTAK